MTFKEYIKWLFGPHKVNNYTNNPRYYSSSRWLAGGQDVRTEMSVTEMDGESVEKSVKGDNPAEKVPARDEQKVQKA